MDLVRRILRVAIPFAILAILVNDGGRYLSSLYELGNITREAASLSADQMKPTGGDRTQVWQAGENYAEQNGAVIYGFDINGQNVHLWTRMPVKGMWVAHRVAAAINKKPLSALLEIEDEATAMSP